MDVREKLNRIFQETFNDKAIQIRPEMTANDVDGWDSFSHVTLILAIETGFSIKFALREVMGFKNVGDLIKGIEKKIVV